ncbi:DUF3558 family protein [Streptomyces sp. NRRL S-340]|uniref:DUF3558 family protein n=1 Tax=Streptomyces sp. NRRL S-340 TaxID=1463901 RepID=UPI000D1AEFBD|nr:DUF3558 family protein [Streptomyces sp. NRRL S-340]
MQRAAQREQRDRRDQREGRGPRAKRLHRALVCAGAVPVLLLAAACSSSDSNPGSDDASKSPAAGAKTSASPSASPTVQPAKYAKLPDACKVLARKTLDDLVPRGAKSAKAGTSSDVGTRSSCSWNGLDNNGVKGSQYRWLNVSLLRFESDTARGTGEEQAQVFYRKQVGDAQAVADAKNTKSQPVSGTGDEATAVRYDLKKKEGTFKQQTVVARVENVVVTLDYNGAGLAGDKAPDADDLSKDAVKAAKEVVASVTEANGGTGTGSAGSGEGSSGKPASGSASGTPSTSPSGPASKSASPSASQSASKASDDR